MDHTYRIILHGKRATDEPLRRAVHKLREEGTPIDVRVTWEAGDSLRLATEAARAGITTVIAAGGDGSINEVVTGVLQSQVDPLPTALPNQDHRQSLCHSSIERASCERRSQAIRD